MKHDVKPPRWTAIGLGAALLAAASGSPALADNSSGIDSMLVRPTFDNLGAISVEGGATMPTGELVLKLWSGYRHAPLRLAVPGIGGAADDTGVDQVLSYAASLHMTVALALHDRVTVALDAGAYRTDPDAGYGERGRYRVDMSTPSTGLIALRPLSNIDESGSLRDDGRAGPLDLRVAAKIGLFASPKFNLAAVAAARLPFGEDQMFMGDAGFVLEPNLALDGALTDKVRVLGNLGLRVRERTILESYDPMTQTDADARIVMDVGSEMSAGAGVVASVSPRLSAAAEVTALVPLPGDFALGSCLRHDRTECEFIESDDYFGDAGEGDLAVAVNAGVSFRINNHVTANAIAGASPVGARGDSFFALAGITWSPQPDGEGAIVRDQDGDGISDSLDGCPSEAEDQDGNSDEDGCPDSDDDGDGIDDSVDKCVEAAEDRDGYMDDDGCPERDNDEDGIDDTIDKCPGEREDIDGFTDQDGCPEPDNDGDGFADREDRCPNDAETVNGIDDADGCPESQGSTLPVATKDIIDLKGGKVSFQGRGVVLTAAAKKELQEVARLLKGAALSVRVEVHVSLSTKSPKPAAIKAAQKKDKLLAVRRAVVVLEYLVGQGVKGDQLQAVGIGSSQALPDKAAYDPANDRVEFVKVEKTP